MSESEKVDHKAAAVKRVKEKKAAEEASKAAKSGPKVAPGKTITSKRGILDSESGYITAADLAGGEAAIKTLLDKGILVK